MRRLAWAGALVLVLIYAAAALLGRPIMASYLAAWLFCLSVPVGALPVVCGLELAGLGGSLHTGYLRWLLLLMPVAALAGLPVLFFLPSLYPWVSHPLHGFAGAWWSPVPFAVRSVAYLAVWTVLALLSAQPPQANTRPPQANTRPPQAAARAGLCCAGLVLHVAVGTLAATDWIMSLTPGLNAAGFGLLVLAGQSALALGAGVLLVPARPAGAAPWLVTAMVAWGAMQFTQYLIIWSANQPGEIAWYIQRGGALGDAASWAGAAVLLLCVALLGPAWLAGRRFVLAGCGAAVVLVQMAATLWLVTPSIRGRFTLALPDLAVPVAALLFAALAWSLRPRAVPA